MAQFSGSVTVANEYTLLGNGSVYNQLTFTTVAQEIKVGGSKLAGRKTLTIQAHPDNAGYIYIGLDNTVTNVKYFIALSAGMPITIKFNSIDALSIWGYGSAAGQLLGVLEGKSS